MNNSYVLDIAEDENGDQVLQLSDVFCHEQDWREGDIINWEVKDGVAIATNKCAQERKKQTNKKLVLVETFSFFRHRYVVECDEEEHAADEVVMCKEREDFEEFSQQHIDEVVTSTRTITEQEYFKLFDKDNDYLAKWDVEQKKRFINKINYNE